MSTVVLSQLLGLVRQRLLVSIFGASDTVGIYLVAQKLPDFLFQLTIAAALTTAFIPVFSDLLVKNRKDEAHHMASILLSVGTTVYALLALILTIFAPFFLQLFNLGDGYTPEQMALMANLMQILIVGQLLFIVGTFFTVLLQSYNHFFIPGIAAASYNLGIIFGLLTLSPILGIYSAAVGVIIGASIFILIQYPLVKKVGYSFHFNLSYKNSSIQKIIHLMWPRTLSNVIYYVGTISIVAIISFLPSPGRKNLIFDYAQVLAFAPVALFGQTIAQAAFPVLSREKDRLDDFKITFMTSFNQMLFLILPISALILVLRIPIVRLVFGAEQFDWEATVLTGRTLAFFSFSIFAQALIALTSRGFYALHNSLIPLIVGAFSTAIMIVFVIVAILVLRLDVESIAIAYSIASIIQLIILLTLLDRRIGGFNKQSLFLSLTKFFFATLFTAFALYVPLKLLDQLVFDTTRTINLILLTGISSIIGLSLYLFLTWIFNVKEAETFLLLFKRVGNWRSILGQSEEKIGD
jgi:putative peptidoglycan lipid II flippase